MGDDSSDLTLLRTIEEWFEEAREEIYDIGGWRTDTQKRFGINPNRSKLSDWFFGRTQFILTDCRRLNKHFDPRPINKLYEWIRIWYDDESAKRLPSQVVMERTLDMAWLQIGPIR